MHISNMEKSMISGGYQTVSIGLLEGYQTVIIRLSAFKFATFAI